MSAEDWLFVGFAGVFGLIASCLIGGMIGRSVNRFGVGLLSGILGPIGWIIVLLLPRDSAKKSINFSDFSASENKAQVIEAPEKRDLSNDAYKLYLAEKYGIRRNEAFEKFVCDNKMFDSMDIALAHADRLEAIDIKNFSPEISEAVPKATMIYILYLASPLIAFFTYAVLAVLPAIVTGYFCRSDKDGWVTTHYEFQIRNGWIVLLTTVLMWAFKKVFMGVSVDIWFFYGFFHAAILGILFCWVFWKSFNGIKELRANRPIEKTRDRSADVKHDSTVEVGRDWVTLILGFVLISITLLVFLLSS